jgi:hypothetical protein
VVRGGYFGLSIPLRFVESTDPIVTIGGIKCFTEGNATMSWVEDTLGHKQPALTN